MTTQPSRSDQMAETAFSPLARRAKWSDPRQRRASVEMAAWNDLAAARTHAFVERRPVKGSLLRVGVKDVVDVAGWSTSLGLGPNASRTATTTVPALRHVPPDAIVAKTVTTELGIGLEHCCVNLAFPHIDPGGSSTGSAIAVAAGACDVALGTDSVASVRLPAAASGVVGLRTTGMAGELDPGFTLSRRLDVAGWFARKPDDLAYAWERWIRPGTFVPTELRTAKVVVVEDALAEVIDAPMATVVEQARHALHLAGARCETMSLGELFHQRGLAYDLCVADASRAVAESPGLREQLSTSTARALAGAENIDEPRLAERVADLRARAREALGSSDLWLLPAGSQLPLDLRREQRPESTIPDVYGPPAAVNNAAMAAMLSLPSISVPIDGGDLDVPLSVQPVAAPGADALLVAAAVAVSRKLPLPDLRALTKASMGVGSA